MPRWKCRRTFASALLALTVAALPAVSEGGDAEAWKPDAGGARTEGRAPIVPGISRELLESLNLSREQSSRITAIERDMWRETHRLVGEVRELRWKQQDAFRASEVDAEAARRIFAEIQRLRRQMFEVALDARKRIEGVLTAEQRAQIGGAGRDGRGPKPR